MGIKNDYVSHSSLLYTTMFKSIKSIEEVNDDIIGDILMDKVKVNEEGKLIVNINDYAKHTIDSWYYHASNLIDINEAIVVYRGVKFMDRYTNIYQPIPFSTCMCKDNASLWTIENDKRSFIMKINVKCHATYMRTENDSEGDEVILPSGTLKYKKEDGDVSVYDFCEDGEDSM